MLKYLHGECLFYYRKTHTQCTVGFVQCAAKHFECSSLFALEGKDLFVMFCCLLWLSFRAKITHLSLNICACCG